MTPSGPPQTKRENTSYERHGDLIDDPYRWLEQGGEAVDEWVDRQNEYADDYLESVPVREDLQPRFESLARTTDYGTITAAPTGYFQEVETPDDEQPVLYSRESLEDDREVLVDPNEFSEDATKSMGWWTVSPDGERLAYGVDEGGNELYDVTVIEVPSGEELEELAGLGRAGPGMFAWTPDGFYYGRTGKEGEAQLEKEIYLHEHGDDPGADALVYEVDVPSMWPMLSTNRDGDHLLVSLIVGWERSDLLYAEVGETELTPVVTDADHLYTPLIHGDTAYVRTNLDAPYYRFIELDLSGDLDEVDPAELPEIVPERDGIVTGATIADDRLLVQYERAAVSELEAFDLNGDHLRSVDLPGTGTLAGLNGNRDAPEAFFSYQSFDHPPAVFRYDLEADESAALDRPDVSLEFNLTVDQVRYESGDGTEIPMFVVHRADLERDGDNPALLYGYGGFENSLTPTFQKFGGEFLRSGGVYAVANLRGGGEFGKEWHEAARHEQKQHTFDDMIAAAEYLLEEGYTSSERLAIQGGSNGGLTVGAVLTQRPDLLAAVCCQVPLLDMLRFHTFLLGASWTSEYGSPDDPEAYEYIKAYSPYHNVEGGADGPEYPPVLFETAEGDTRVHPVHAWKMVARMQSVANGGPFRCKTNRDTGHGTGKPTWMIVEEQLDTWSFLFDQLNVEYVEP
ncbi:prolyl oligopeptidase family serine peptidase [Natronorubrum sp. JWXQ-INN-674]|uniref:prolyl oligopeptidase n=1 Tax=Natronorubrum halalkaliphilum TaxID=2691917 RepID=A0A6B0VSX9_9EURY|nr:prolyl oligopeptidase family serine peptidase [Natronorubrum halalkaliphilum]MXV64253.1 prolyl oligopeptidase family serine peptidase [Natronorubrum halalkaliphilum]